MFTLLQRKKKINLALNFYDDDDDEGNAAAIDAHGSCYNELCSMSSIIIIANRCFIFWFLNSKCKLNATSHAILQYFILQGYILLCKNINQERISLFWSMRIEPL